MKRKQLALLLGTLIAGLGLSFATSYVAFANNKDEIKLQSNIEENLVVNDTLKIPEATISHNGKEYEATFYTKFPSGVVNKNKDLFLNEGGKYSIYYSINVDNKVIRKEINFFVSQQMYSVVGDNSTLYWGTNEVMGDEIGINLGLAPNERFTFNKPIDLSAFNSAKRIINFKVNPETIGVADAMKIVVTLTDVHDPENYIKIQIKKCDDDGAQWAEVATYTAANAAGQDSIGLEASKSGDVITYNGKTYLLHRNNAFGTYTQFSMCGAPMYVSKSLPNYDKKHLKTQNYGLSMDYKNGIIYANDSLVTDLKSDVIYGNKLWQGFTTGEAYITVQALNYNAERCNLFINTLGGEPASNFVNNVYIDKEAPNLTIDLKGYDEDNLPSGKVGHNFKLFNATAYDFIDKEVEVKTDVYLNRGLANECKIDVVNKSFTPKYAAVYDVVYKAVDKSGNEATKVIKINVGNDGKALAIDKIIENTKDAKVGTVVKLNELTYKENEGVVNENIKVINLNSNKEYEVNNHEFIPLEVGKFKAIYTYNDYIYEQEYSYEFEVSGNDTPIILDEISIDKYFIVGCNYKLPIIDAYEFTKNVANKINTDIYINLNNKGFNKINGNEYIFNEEGKAVIKYIASINGKETSKEKEIEIVDVGINETLKLGKYFYGNEFTSEATNKYIDYSSNVNNGSSKMEFIRPLQIDNFQIRFSSLVNKNNYQRINIYLTDIDDENNKIKFSYEKDKTGYVRFNVNDGNKATYDYLFASDNDPIIFEYNNQTMQASPYPNKYQDVVVEGFASRMAYLSIELEGITGESGIRIYNVNGQPLTSVTGDIIDPKIAASPDLGDKQINTLVTIKGVTIQDIIDPCAESYMTVTDPDKQVVVANDGTVLDKTADFRKDYQIVLSKYGDYLVYYYAKDANDNEAIYSYVLTVVDTLSPEVEILNQIKEGTKGNKIDIASIQVKDAASDTFSVFVCLRDPQGHFISLGNNVDGKFAGSKSFVPNEAGIYTVYYYIMDKSGNSTICQYTIKIN